MTARISCLIVSLSIVLFYGCTEVDSNDDATPESTNVEPSPPVQETVQQTPEPQPEPAPEPIPDVTTEGLSRLRMLRRTIQDLDKKYGMYGRDKVFILRFSSFPSPDGLREIYSSIAEKKESGSDSAFDAFYIACAMPFTIDEMIPKVTYGKVVGIDRPNGVLHIELNQDLQVGRREFINRPVEQWGDWEHVIAAGGRQKCVLITFENVESYDEDIAKVRSDILRSLDQVLTRGHSKEPFWLMGYYAGNVTELSQKIESGEVVSVDEEARTIHVKFP